MGEIAYTVSATIADPEKAQEWLSWLRGGHIAEVLKGGATEAVIVRLDPEADAGGAVTYEIQYKFPDRAVFESYLAHHAPRLRSEGLALFPPEAGFVYSRRIGEIL